MGKNDKKGGDKAGSKAKGGDKEAGGKAKGTQLINVRHILVSAVPCRALPLGDVAQCAGSQPVSRANVPSAKSTAKRKKRWRS